MSGYNRHPATDSNTVMDCAECAARDGMRHVDDLTDNSETKCGETWKCTACGVEYVDEW